MRLIGLRANYRTIFWSFLFVVIGVGLFALGAIYQYYRTQWMLVTSSAPIAFSSKSESRGCPRDAVVIGVFGQSNSTSRPENVFSGDKDIFEYSPIDGTCVSSLAKESTIRGNAAYGAALLLKNRGEIKGPIVVTSWGGNATSVIEWGSGNLAYKTVDVLQRVSRDVGSPLLIFYHQGERDAVMLNRRTGMSGAIYQSNLDAIIQSIHNLSPDTSVGIAMATVCGFGGGSSEIRRAQAAMAHRDAHTFLSADSDSLSDRIDGCHLSNVAMRRLAAYYAASYERYRKSKGATVG